MQQNTSAVKGKVSGKKKQNTQEQTNKERIKGLLDLLDKEYCRNTFDIFPNLLDGS